MCKCRATLEYSSALFQYQRVLPTWAKIMLQYPIITLHIHSYQICILRTLHLISATSGLWLHLLFHHTHGKTWNRLARFGPWRPLMSVYWGDQRRSMWQEQRDHAITMQIHANPLSLQVFVCAWCVFWKSSHKKSPGCCNLGSSCAWGCYLNTNDGRPYCGAVKRLLSLKRPMSCCKCVTGKMVFCLDSQMCALERPVGTFRFCLIITVKLRFYSER